jgi:hypothetical protein
MRIGDSVSGQYANARSCRWFGRIVGVAREPDLFWVCMRSGQRFKIFERDLELAGGDEREIKVELGGRGE